MLTGADIGHVVRVEVTAANDAGDRLRRVDPRWPRRGRTAVNVYDPDDHRHAPRPATS